MPRALRLCSILLAALLLTAGCGSDDRADTASDDAPPTPSESTATAGRTPSQQPTKAPGTGAKTVDIRFTGDTVKPQGSAMKVEAGQPLTLRITADKPGELHVHSTPEQEIEYAAGTSEKTLTIEQPGLVDVESHDLDTLIVKLEVR